MSHLLGFGHCWGQKRDFEICPNAPGITFNIVLTRKVSRVEELVKWVPENHVMVVCSWLLLHLKISP